MTTREQIKEKLALIRELGERQSILRGELKELQRLLFEEESDQKVGDVISWRIRAGSPVNKGVVTGFAPNGYIVCRTRKDGSSGASVVVKKHEILLANLNDRKS